MSFWIAGAIVVTSAATTIQSKKAAKKAAKQAKEDALEADLQARKSEIFAETEGEGIGNLGQISLEVDQDLEDDEVASNLRI